MIIIFFVLGLIVGSFLNVVIYRLKTVETLLGRSNCPSCKKQIRWYDNIPLISFIFLDAKCRDCHEKISWQYPLVEFGTGIVFAFVGYYFFSINNAQSILETIFYLGIFSCLIVIFTYDFKYMEIPMTVFWIAIVWTVIFFIVFDFLNFKSYLGIFDSVIVSGVVAGSIAGTFFFSLVYFSKEKWMGAGDVYIGFLAGLIVGWPSIFWTLTISFATGAISGLTLIATNKKTLQSKIPYAPFLVSAIFLVIFIKKFFPNIQNILPYF